MIYTYQGIHSCLTAIQYLPKTPLRLTIEDRLAGIFNIHQKKKYIYIYSSENIFQVLSQYYVRGHFKKCLGLLFQSSILM